MPSSSTPEYFLLQVTSTWLPKRSGVGNGVNVGKEEGSELVDGFDVDGRNVGTWDGNNVGNGESDGAELVGVDVGE